jgi:ArsR family metal-binding transcriptional regulator
MPLQMHGVTKTTSGIVGDECMRVWDEFRDVIRGILPYLNSVIREASYGPQQQSLGFPRGEKGLNLTPCEISIAQARSMEDAQSTADELRDYAPLHQRHLLKRGKPWVACLVQVDSKT